MSLVSLRCVVRASCFFHPKREAEQRKGQALLASVQESFHAVLSRRAKPVSDSLWLEREGEAQQIRERLKASDMANLGFAWILCDRRQNSVGWTERLEGPRLHPGSSPML